MIAFRLSIFIPVASAAQCRDRFLEPFSSDSIWNTAIGSNAQFAPVDIYRDSPICKIKVAGACDKYPQLSNHDWFDDERFGGPIPSDEARCTARGKSWQKDCIHATVKTAYYSSSSTCGLPPCKAATQFHNDQEFFLQAGDDEVPWIDQGDWGGGDKCEVKGSQFGTIPLPKGWTTAGDGGRSAANQINNNGMGLLLADGRTLVQMQPVYRCEGGPFLARFGNGTDGTKFPNTDGCPQPFPNTTDVLGDGALGAHGGSGLSAVGGMIRSGELHPEAPPINHALKIELQHQWYYGDAPLQQPSAYNGGRVQYMWPAVGSDGGTTKAPGGLYQGHSPHLAPGALLAIPADLAGSVKIKTVLGAKIKQALVDYGAYIVDDTGGGNSGAICMQAEVNAEMRADFGYAMSYPHGISGKSSDAGHELYEDLLQSFQALHAVVNNGPDTIGGGGTPRQPRKVPICDAEAAEFRV